MAKNGRIYIHPNKYRNQYVVQYNVEFSKCIKKESYEREPFTEHFQDKNNVDIVWKRYSGDNRIWWAVNSKPFGFFDKSSEQYIELEKAYQKFYREEKLKRILDEE